MRLEIAKKEEWKDAPDWYKDINVNDFEKLAACGFTPKQLAMYYRIKYDEFLYYFNLVGSPLKYSYERGQLSQTAKEGIFMSDSFKNPEQANRFDKLRASIDFKNAVESVFNPDCDV